MKSHRRRRMIPACGPALLMLIVIATDTLWPALADPNEALANAVAGAFTPAQISELIAAAAGKVSSRTDQDNQSISHLRQLLDVSSDGVVLALLRILDQPEIQATESARALAQSATQYHAVADRLNEITAQDPEGQRLVTQAKAAMIAGHFNDTEALLRQLADREVIISNRSLNDLAEPASSATQHLISAAQAGTVLGEIALMQLRYDEATGYFQAAQQRLSLLAQAEPDPAEPRPADTAPVKPADVPSTAETEPSLPQSDIESSKQARLVKLTPLIDPDPPTASPEQISAAIGSDTTAANALAAVPTAAPHGLPEQPTGSLSGGAVLSADMISLLLRRGDASLARGDVSAARLLYERVAAGGDGRGATGAGKTYDPVFLLAIGARGIEGDPVAAANWYRRAIELGDQTAVQRLTQMSQRSDR
jgi:TPR repeat protein